MPRHDLQLESAFNAHPDGRLEAKVVIKNPIMSKGGKLPNWHATAHELAAQYLADVNILKQQLIYVEKSHNSTRRILSTVYDERDEAHRLLRVAKRSPWWWLMAADIKARARELGL